MDEIPPLVFIHGIKGSILCSQNTKKIHYISGSSALGLHSPPLALPMEWEIYKENEDSEGIWRQKQDDLTSTGPLESVLFVSVYAKFINWAKSYRSNFHPFHYDWRRDNDETVGKFIKFLEGLGRPAQVVAHSNGGLVSLATINRRPELFHSIVFVGVPFGSGIGIFTDFHKGEPLGLNKAILSPSVCFTFPTFYQFLPNLLDMESRAKDKSLPPYFADESGNPIIVDLMNAEDWQKHKLSLFSPHLAHCTHPKHQWHISSHHKDKDSSVTKEQIDEKVLNHLRRCLERAVKFKEQLQYNADVKYPKISVLTGEGHETLCGLVRRQTGNVQSFGIWDFDIAEKRTDGDGRIRTVKAQPPSEIPVKSRHVSHYSHSKLLDDTSTLLVILEELLAD